MPTMTLIIGNKNYSSWSMRAWLALRQTGVAFDELVIHLGQENRHQAIHAHSPSGKVPVLKHGAIRVWETLAIIEYLAEQFPEARLWPEEPSARAHARAIAAEMHASFAALRQCMPMNVRASRPGVGHTVDAEADVERISEIWRDCRERFGAAGPFLFGPFGAADCMYAPVVTRLMTYAVKLDDICRVYADATLNWPPVKEWIAAAHAEPMSIPRIDDA
jgi:glutathione S-transferase